MTRPPGFLDPLYLAWVRSLPCCVCQPGVLRAPWAHAASGQVRSDPHHLPHPALYAMGRKGPDAFCVPLCRGPRTPNHHPRADHLGPSEVIALDGVNLWAAAAVLRWEYLLPGRAEAARASAL